AVEGDERGISIVQDVRRPGITIAWLSDAPGIEDQRLFAECDRVSVSMRGEVQPTLFDMEDEVRMADHAEARGLERKVRGRLIWLEEILPLRRTQAAVDEREVARCPRQRQR